MAGKLYGFIDIIYSQPANDLANHPHSQPDSYIHSQPGIEQLASHIDILVNQAPAANRFVSYSSAT